MLRHGSSDVEWLGFYINTSSIDPAAFSLNTTPTTTGHSHGPYPAGSQSHMLTHSSYSLLSVIASCM